MVGEFPSQDDGGRPVFDKNSVRGQISFRRGTYPAAFENIFIVRRNRMRGNYRIPFSGDKSLRAVLELETPSLSLPILVL